MLRLSRQADYGVWLMAQFAALPPGSTMSAREASVAAQLPLPMVAKTLKVLHQHALLTSRRGVKGGYALRRRPEQISLGAILAALEGPVALTDCTDVADHACEHEECCRVRVHWHRINRAVRAAVDRISLAELARPGCFSTPEWVGTAAAEDWIV